MLCFLKTAGWWRHGCEVRAAKAACSFNLACYLHYLYLEFLSIPLSAPFILVSGVFPCGFNKDFVELFIFFVVRFVITTNQL